MRKVSVIVPMYNAQDTINECLDSIVAQTLFNDLELIIVDDCSTDNSFAKASIYEKQYPDNIALISLDKNCGPGAARNVALSYANGEYVGFVDSDDAIVPTMYEKLFAEAINSDSDFVDSGFYKQQDDQAILYTSDELSGHLDDHKKSELIIHGGYIVTRIFRREFLSSNNILFREAYMLEDLDFLAEVIARSEHASSVKEIFYIYRDSSSSLSKSTDVIKYVNYHSEAILGLYKRTSCLPNYSGIQDAVEFLIIRMYSYMVNACMNAVYLNEHSSEEIIPVLNILRTLKNNTVRHGYDTSYISRGISRKDLMILKTNDISAQAALALQS